MKIIKQYNRNIYREQYLRAAADSYREIGKIQMKPEGDYMILTFSSDRVSPELMAMEFDNFLIEMENSGELNDNM